MKSTCQGSETGGGPPVKETIKRAKRRHVRILMLRAMGRYWVAQKVCFFPLWNSPGGSDSEESICNVGDLSSVPGLERFPWRRAWQPTPVFLAGKSHGQRSLVGYSPCGCKELDTTERPSTARHTD